MFEDDLADRISVYSSTAQLLHPVEEKEHLFRAFSTQSSFLVEARISRNSSVMALFWLLLVD